MKDFKKKVNALVDTYIESPPNELISDATLFSNSLTFVNVMEALLKSIDEMSKEHFKDREVSESEMEEIKEIVLCGLTNFKERYT